MLLLIQVISWGEPRVKFVKIDCEIRYAERTKILAGYEAIYSDMLKKAPEQAERWVAPGLRIDDKDKKRVMLIDPTRTAITIEQPPNVGFCRDSIMQFLKSVDERIGIPNVARHGIRSTWIFEYQGSFEDLLNKCKQHIFGNSKLAEKVDDVAAVFEYLIGTDQKIALTTGPMKIEQLKSQYLSFEPESFPPLFLYVDVDLGDSGTKKYSAQYLREFFDKAVSEGERLSRELATELGVS